MLLKMHKHEYCSSSWKIRLSQRLDCPELGTHKVEVTETCRKQIQIGMVEHLEMEFGID